MSTEHRELAPYAALLAHAELELELAGRGELTEMAGLEGRWQELSAAVPERAPAGAAELLSRARLIHERTHIELIRMREALFADLAGAAQAKRTADGYAASGVSRTASALDARA